MNFKELLQHLEERLGSHHFPVNPIAVGIKDVFASGPLHHDLMVRIVRAIYKDNDCRNLKSAVNAEKTFGAIAPIRQEVLRSATTDVDLYRAIDDLCHALNSIFGLLAPTTPPKPTTTTERRTSAEIIQIDPARRRRRLKSLA